MFSGLSAYVRSSVITCQSLCPALNCRQTEWNYIRLLSHKCAAVVFVMVHILIPNSLIFKNEKSVAALSLYAALYLKMMLCT